MSKNLHCEYANIFELGSAAWDHHELPQSITERNEEHVQAMLRHVEERGLPF